MRRTALALACAAATLLAASAGLASHAQAEASQASVLRVGTFNGIRGQFATIQQAVDAARPGDWILVAPGDYHEAASKTDGVAITTAWLHLRGMNRNTTVVDGTKPTAQQCSAKPTDQVPGRNGIEVKANDVWVENLTVCNYLTDTTGAQGNEIWWNGGDGSGKVGMDGFWGNYLTATASYSNGVGFPAGNYGIFSSNATNGSFVNSYASNMADSDFYIGACQQQCNTTMNYDHGQYGALCLSSTNAGGYLLVENTECDQNKTGLVSNSQNNDDWPSPQNGLCPKGTNFGPAATASCTVWMNNYIHDNNNPNVPGSGAGLAGGAPVGTGMILAGSIGVTLYNNTVVNNGAWGELIADLPDQESAPANDPIQCQGGTWVPPPAGVCYYPAFANISLFNHFANNGFFGNPSNGDFGLATNAHSPGNCFHGDSDNNGLTTDPPGIEHSSTYQMTGAACTKPNTGDYALLGSEALCATQLVFPCPDLGFPAHYPRPSATFTLPMPAPQATMPNPCDGVPNNPWCP